MSAVAGAPVWIQAAPAAQVAVIAALELEARTLRRPRSALPATVYVSGPGRARAEASAARAVTAGACAMLSWGLAGGLDSSVRTGTVIVPAHVIDESGSLATHDAWRRAIVARLDADFIISEGPLYSADAVVTSVTDKRAIARRTGAVAVDMESAGIARVASRAGLPFLALRVVADGPDDALPDGVASLVTARGGTRVAGLCQFAAAPRQLPLLMKLARNSKLARQMLERVAVASEERSA